jgi:FkbM family methyltransferase
MPAVEDVERDGWRFRFTNREQFDRIWQDVVDGREYEMGDLGPRPVIIDGGAHVGVASHWFARRYPGALVLAFEANPETAALLRGNLAANGLDGRVRVHGAAIGPRTEPTAFYATPGDNWGDAVVRHRWHAAAGVRPLRVPGVALSDLLATPIDLLKLDIEGAEAAALAAAAGGLRRVRRVVLEFHGSRSNPANRIEDVLATLVGAGFRTRVEQDGQPVVLRRVRRDDPFWLIVRGWRNGDGWAPAEPARRRRRFRLGG